MEKLSIFCHLNTHYHVLFLLFKLKCILDVSKFYKLFMCAWSRFYTEVGTEFFCF